MTHMEATEKKEIKVSVVVPVYNVAGYLEKSLNSLVHQTLSEIEILCIDDASTDESYSILKKYEEKYPQLIVLQNSENRGQSYSRNRGINAAKGEYIQFVDADDFLENDALETLYRKAKAYHLDLLRFNYMPHDSVHENARINQKHYAGYTCESVRDNTELFYCLMMDRTAAFECYPWLNFLRRKWVLENQLFFREGMIFEDILYTYKLFMCSGRAMTLDKKMYHYLLREGSTVTKEVGQAHIHGQLLCVNEIIKEMTAVSEIRAMTASSLFLWNLENNILPLIGMKKAYMDLSSWDDELVELLGALFRQDCYVNFAYVKSYRKEIEAAEALYIYGAGKACDWLLDYLKRLSVTPTAIVVSSRAGNPEQKQGIRVLGIDEIHVRDETCLWLCAVKGKFEEVSSLIKEHGYTNIIDATMV